MSELLFFVKNPNEIGFCVTVTVTFKCRTIDFASIIHEWTTEKQRNSLNRFESLHVMIQLLPLSDKEHVIWMHSRSSELL